MLVVIAVSTLVYRYFQRGQESQISLETAEMEREAGFVTPVDLPTIYEVQRGDHLWQIAEKFYRSGYNWTDIALENKLSHPDLLAVGQKLTIPDIEPKTITAETEETDYQQAISPGKYTVKGGDWLSKIALRAYGDMFAWEKIYQANKETIGPNPDLIEIGQVLTIPE